MKYVYCFCKKLFAQQVFGVSLNNNIVPKKTKLKILIIILCSSREDPYLIHRKDSSNSLEIPI